MIQLILGTWLVRILHGRVTGSYPRRLPAPVWSTLAPDRTAPAQRELRERADRSKVYTYELAPVWILA